MGLFDSNSVDYSGIERTYDQSSKQILDAINAAQAQGRTDIADALKKSYGMNQPYMQAGNTAMSAYMNSLGIGDQGARGQSSLMNQFQQSPGYQYALQQAQGATERRAAATGQNMSGAESRELGAQAQGLANQDWNNWLNNYQNRLSNIAGMGQQSTAQQAGFEVGGGKDLASLGMGYTQMSVQEMQAAAKAKAEAEMAQQTQNAQSKNSWLSGIGSLIGGGAGFMLGGPAGMALGATMGGGLGGGGNSPNYSQFANPNIYSNAYGQNQNQNQGQSNWLTNWQQQFSPQSAYNWRS